MNALALVAEPEPVPAASSTRAWETARHAMVLARLIQDNQSLPVLVWTVYPSGLVGRAVGRSDWHVSAAVRAWAKAFKVPVEVVSVPAIVARHRPGGEDQWVVEPGEIQASFPAFDGTIVGELLEVKPGDQR